MSSSKTALRSSETCLILDFSTTRSSSTFDVTFEEVCDENGGKSDCFFFSRPENGGKSDYERETTKVIEDILSDLGFLHYLVLFHLLWEFVVVRVMVRVKKICPSQSNKQKSKSNKKKKTKYLPYSRIPSPPPPYQS